MSYTKFSELKVYKLSEELANSIWNMVNNWDRFAKNTMGKQLVNAADSIGANIAEGHGKGYFADNRRFVRIARGSLFETKHFLRLSFQRKLMTEKDVDVIEKLINKLGPSMNAYLNKIGTSTEPNEES